MGVTTTAVDGDSESAALLISPNPDKIPRDAFHLAYIIYFTLGTGYLLPWNAFITAVDYFSFLYPDASVDRVFAVVYVMVGLLSVLVSFDFGWVCWTWFQSFNCSNDPLWHGLFSYFRSSNKIRNTTS